MRKYVLLLGAVGAVIAALAFTTKAKAGDQAGKVTICHYPPGNPANVHEITISENAWSAHESHHGDFIKTDCAPCPCLEEGGEN